MNEQDQQISPIENIPINESNNKKSISLPAAVLSGAVIIAIAIIVAFGPKNVQAPTKNTAKVANDTEVTKVDPSIVVVRPNDRVRGDVSKAEVVVFEYSDSDCPFCSRFHPTLTTLMDEYKGKLAWVYRYYPLTGLHPNAYTEALALECAGKLGGNNAFNKYLDSVINITLNPDPKANEMLLTLASQQGIDSNSFKTCLKDSSTAKIIDTSVSEAQKIGARGTPFSVIVNLKTGKQVSIPGAYPIEEVRKQIDTLLK